MLLLLTKKSPSHFRKLIGQICGGTHSREQLHSNSRGFFSVQNSSKMIFYWLRINGVWKETWHPVIPSSPLFSEFSTLEPKFISQIDKICSSVIKSNKVELLSHMQKIEKKFLSKGSSESLESNSRDMINEFLWSTEFPHKTTGVNPSHFLHFLAQDGSFEATTNRDLDNYELSLPVALLRQMSLSSFSNN